MTAVLPDAPAEGAPSRLEPLRKFTRTYAGDAGGITGLAILVAVTVLGLTAPLFIHASDLSVVDATGRSLAPPSAHYPLGTDQPGRSVLTLLAWGTRPSLAIGVIATVVTVAIGSVIGLLAGHQGGVVSRVLMAVTDWFIALPSAAAGDLAGGGARSGRRVDHDRHRGDHVDRHR
jgi:peptide/nickel transport system permease protein